ncbi:MAG: UDP-N-acetylglucosamine--N-acetylmuramyl-(pentapeptide) pyrophosphoryl-UDP N-acetylglucosamine [Patescibacteria group bacterium]|nr:UDP-N-acetylglucosamine--N-acetylmuramyl-(pentapeptide) pyrophosphoryl-UDP N-acetylglucosamine [Patescibacteria group bacterium]
MPPLLRKEGISHQLIFCYNVSMIKILFTGGGTGGHFYPLIAVAQEINKIVDEEKIANVRMYYFSDAPYDEQALFENGIQYKKVSAGKMRVSFSLQIPLDIIKMAIGVVQGFFAVFSLYPDVVFAKGAYASFPTLFAARLLGIPVVIHESDYAPGRVTAWAGKFAKFIAVSYKESFAFFPAGKTAHVGQPVRPELEHIAHGGIEYFGLEAGVPVIFILGGSSGAQLINEKILEALADLLPKYQIIHQTGKNLFDEVKKRSEHILRDSQFRNRYKPIPFLNILEMRMSAGIAFVVISRAGSTIFEIASWGVPSIIVPFTVSNNDHARKNAYAYARAGACQVVEEKNLTPHVLIEEINRINDDLILHDKMAAAAHAFFQPDAAKKIAEKVLEIGLSHIEKK